MRLLMPIIPDPSSLLGRANPLAKLVAAFILLLALFVSLDGVTAGLVLVVLLALLPVSGVGVAALLRRSRLLLLAACSVAVVNTLLAPEQAGTTLLELGPMRIGTETALSGIALGLRLLAIALAGLLATATSDPLELADALVQQWRVSPRFALGALAALRLLPAFAREWQTIGLARRARGVDAGRSPVAWVRLLGGRLLALLVGGVRRAARMAAAMESRGLGSRDCRTAARPQRMRAADWGWIAGAVVLGAGAIALSVRLGTWRFLLG
ncbi:MAG: CbiQ family ECF transporter T component [Chloroflexota bacterium]